MISWTPGVARQMMTRYDMTRYPDSYKQIRQDLMISVSGEQWLQLPRHSYHRCQWTNKVLYNSFGRYMYPIPVIISDNIEI